MKLFHPFDKNLYYQNEFAEPSIFSDQTPRTAARARALLPRA